MVHFSLVSFLTVLVISVSSINSTAPSFISGLNNTHSFTEEDITKDNNSGIKLPLKFNTTVKPIQLHIFYNNSGQQFNITFANNKTVSVFGLGVDNEIFGGGEEEKLAPLSHSYQFGQYDFEKDGIDELVISAQVQRDDFTCVYINVLKYFPPANNTDVLREQNWELIGEFKVEDILGNPKVKIENNSINIPRNLRGFYHEWTFVKNKFVDTSDY